MVYYNKLQNNNKRIIIKKIEKNYLKHNIIYDKLNNLVN